MNEEHVESLYDTLKKEAEERGYFLNPDTSFTKEIVKGLLINRKRFGYTACPCRLASGIRADDLDIICPCDYRDRDLNDYNACYCALYVSEAIARGRQTAGAIPDRRPPSEKRFHKEEERAHTATTSLTCPVWRCRVCGYLCAREQPPGVCPICKAQKDRFERFM